MGQDFKGKNVAEIAGDLLMERKKLVGDAAAERKGHPTGADEMKRSEEQEAFWKSFTTPEDDARMWAQGKLEGKDDATIKQEISSKKYQRRWELWGKQPDLPSKLKWAQEMQKLGPPEGSQVPGAGFSGAAPLPQTPVPPLAAPENPAPSIQNPGQAPTLADLLGETSPPPLGGAMPPRY